MSTGTESVGEMFSRNIARYQKPTNQSQPELIAKAPVAQIPETKTLPILIRPVAPAWEQLVEKVNPIVNLPGLWITITKLYNEGYGAELVTLVDMVLEIHTKNPKREKPNNLFAASISKTSGNWKTKTLKLIHDAWEARQHAREVIDRLNIEQQPKTYRQVLALAWKLKGTIVRFLGMATEQGTGIKDKTKVFFALCLNATQMATK
jgi:hypothetical protein